MTAALAGILYAQTLVAKLGRGGQSDETAVAAEVINTLDACEVTHGVIALDDVHRVEDPTFFRFLDRLIERMSARWTMAVTSRTEPPIALARLRASGELAEFRQLELQRAAALIARGRFDEAASPLETGRLYTIAPLIDEMVGLLETANRLELWYQLAPPTRVPGLRGVAAPLRRHAENIASVAGDDPTPLRAMASLMHGWDALWRADLDEARAAWRRARADAQWTGSWAAVRGYLLAQGALLDALAGNSEAALATALERIPRPCARLRRLGPSRRHLVCRAHRDDLRRRRDTA